MRVGVSFTVEAGSEVFNVWVTAVEEDKVYVDANHPLAGVTLHFDVEIVEIRDASLKKPVAIHMATVVIITR